MADPRSILVDEALSVRNFLEKHWQFNEPHSYDNCAIACENLYAHNACVTYCGHAIGGPPLPPSSPLAAQQPPFGRADVVSFWAHCPLLRKITSFNYHRIQGAVKGHPQSELIAVQMEAVLSPPSHSREYTKTDPVKWHWAHKVARGAEPDVALSCSLVLIPVNEKGEENPFGKFLSPLKDVELPVTGGAPAKPGATPKTIKLPWARVATEVVRVVE